MGVQQTLKIPPLISTKYFNIKENGYMFWYLLPTRGNYHTIPVSVGIFKNFSILGGRKRCFIVLHEPTFRSIYVS